MKTKKIRKIILIVVAAVVGLILAVVIAAAIIWRHEIGSCLLYTSPSPRDA